MFTEPVDSMLGKMETRAHVPRLGGDRRLAAGRRLEVETSPVTKSQRKPAKPSV